MKIYSKETGFTRSSISKSTRDTNGIDSTVIYDNTRSFTPSSHSNTHDKGNRTSWSFTQDMNSRSQFGMDQVVMQNANRIEWKQCLNLLNLSSFYSHLKNDGSCIMTKNIWLKNSIDASIISPNRQSFICQNSQDQSLNFNHLMDFNFNEVKSEYAYGNPIRQGESQYSNCTSYRRSGGNTSLQCDDEKGSKQKQYRPKQKVYNASHSLQNSARKPSIPERLDSTENLLLRLSDKLDTLIINEPSSVKQPAMIHSKLL